MTGERRVLRVPKTDPATFERNLIRTATCELRFPILLEVEAKPPVRLASALRKQYPYFEKRENVNVRPGARPVETESLYLFHSKKGSWTVTFKSSAIALETTDYTGFTDFSARLDGVLKAAGPVIDSDFFTRVGLRYINVMPVGQEDLEGWVNRDLIAPLVDNVYGHVDAFHQEVRGRAKAGNFSLRHGLAEAKSGEQEYVIDLDFFKETVEADAVLDLVEELHQEAFEFFLWTLSDKALGHMGKRTPKRR